VSCAHRHEPVTLPAVTRLGYGAPVVAVVAFVAFAVGAQFDDGLPWDEPINDWVLDNRSGWIDTIALRVSWFGSTPVIIATAVLLAFVAWRRCPRLAIAVLVFAAARPLVEFTLKELIDRPRPIAGRLVRGKGPAFPSGHPFAFALTWALVPMVVATYTPRRAVWRTAAALMWSLAVLIGASRVWLGVHWLSDVIAGLVLAVMGVSVAEVITARHGCACPPVAHDESADAEIEVGASVIDT